MIGRLEYTLSPFEDVNALKQALLAAARDGAGLVNFRAQGDVEVFALIFPGVTVVVEEREADVTDHAPQVETGMEPDLNTDFDMF
jgi:hypothetical protein